MLEASPHGGGGYEPPFFFAWYFTLAEVPFATVSMEPSWRWNYLNSFLVPSILVLVPSMLVVVPSILVLVPSVLVLVHAALCALLAEIVCTFSDYSSFCAIRILYSSFCATLASSLHYLHHART